VPSESDDDDEKPRGGLDDRQALTTKTASVCPANSMMKRQGQTRSMY
jgi:hypothetical protein